MKRTIQRIVAIVLMAATALWGAALFGFASGLLSDEPPAINPYATGSTTTTPASSVITIVGFAFGGDDAAAVGTEVTISNQSSSSHTWTARDGSFASGSIPAGGTFTFVFDAAGTYEFFCEFHPGMSGSITVTG